MNMINRSDAGGKYISPSSGLNHLEGIDIHLLSPIAYNEDVAEFAAKERISYRDAFLIATAPEDWDVDSKIKQAKKRR